MAKKKSSSRYVVTLYAKDGAVLTSFWAPDVEQARAICRTELSEAKTQRVPSARRDDKVVARYLGKGPGSRREALIRAW